MESDLFKCKKCGDEVGFAPEDYSDSKHPTETCGYCNRGIGLRNAIRDSFEWGGFIGFIKMLFFRYGK